MDAAPFFDIERDAAAAMLSGMVSAIDNQWRACCRAAGMTPAEIERYEPAFDHAETRIARRMAQAR